MKDYSRYTWVEDFRNDAFEYFEWEENSFTHALFKKAWSDGCTHGYAEVMKHMHFMDDIYRAAIKHFEEKK